MIKGRKNNEYFHAELLRTQHQIFQDLGIPVDFRKRYLNPLRPEDKSPECRFNQASNGIIYFNDFAAPHMSGNAFKMYRIKHSANPDTRRYGPPIQQPMPQKKKKNRRATYLKYMTQDMIEYFSRVNVDPTSIRGRYKLLQVSRIFVDELVYRPSDLCMSYKFPSGREKIYRPHADKKNKWTSTANASDIWGWDPLADKIAITSSMKDAITLQREDANRTFIAPQGEQFRFPYEMLDMMRQRDAYVVYDNDKAGIEAVKQFTDLDIPAFVVPTHKDPYGFKSNTSLEIIPNLRLL